MYIHVHTPTHTHTHAHTHTCTEQLRIFTHLKKVMKLLRNSDAIKLVRQYGIHAALECTHSLALRQCTLCVTVSCRCVTLWGCSFLVLVLISPYRNTLCLHRKNTRSVYAYMYSVILEIVYTVTFLGTCTTRAMCLFVHVQYVYFPPSSAPPCSACPYMYMYM